MEILEIGIVQYTHIIHKYTLKTHKMIEFLSLQNKVFHAVDVCCILDISSLLNQWAIHKLIFVSVFLDNEHSIETLQNCYKYSLHHLHEYIASLALYKHILVRDHEAKDK